MRLPDWRNTSRSFALVYLLTICSLQFSPLVSYAQNLGTQPAVWYTKPHAYCALRKMQAVQRDSNGGFRTNVEAQVYKTTKERRTAVH
jgi:hypothetical protein